MNRVYRLVVAAVAAPLAAAGLLTAATSAAAAAPPGVTALRVDYLTDPVGIDDPAPRLSWQLSSAVRGVAQSAYEVRAATSPAALAHPDRWDSGRVASSDSVGVVWQGAPLTSRERVYWQVRVWDQGGAASGWSAPASFEMGLLDTGDWSAQWISNPDWLDRKPTPVTVDVGARDARYLQITTTRLGQPLQEGSSLLYRLQLAEIVVEDSAHPGVDLALGAGITSSDPKTYPGKWEPRFAVDGELTSNNSPNGYSSAGYSGATPSKPITLTLDLGEVRHFDRVLLYGRTDTTTADGRTPNFPSDFTISAAAASGAYTQVAAATGQKEPPAYNIDLPALPLFAKQFTLDKPVRSARLYATGVGIYDARLNGEAVSAAVLQPGNTDYHDRVPYSDNDVTRLLRQGANALSVRLGSGTAIVPDTPDRYTKWSGILGPPELIAQLEITFTDGSTERIVSDGSWRTTLGPTTFSQWYGGEDYDARRAQPGWDGPGADLSAWSAAAVTTPPASTTKLTAQMSPPVQPVADLHTVAVTQPRPGTYLFDLGTNIAGWPVLHVSGPAGTTVTITPGERLGSDGLVDQSTMIAGGATYPPIVDHYTLAGQAVQTWHPDFVYHGFRYLQVTGLASAPTTATVEAIVLRAGNASAGSFDSSSALLDDVHSLVNRSVQGNMFSILTDCPDREKLGWLEQDQLEFDTVARDYDVAAYYEDLVRTMSEAQQPDGSVPAIAPLYYQVFGASGDDDRNEPNWGSAFVMAPWQLYRTYGDLATLRTYYPQMQRYLDYLTSRASGYLLDYGLGDWGAIDTSTPVGITATFGYYRAASTMAQIAGVLGHAADAAGYRQLAVQIATAFNAKYLDAAAHTYGSGSQASDALALDLGVVPDDQRDAVLAHLVASIGSAGDQFTVGEIALPSLLRVLSGAHRDDLVYDVATRTSVPGYGYSVVHGATALPEYWDGATGYGSQDHFMMGAIEQWFSGDLGGIQQAADSVGYRDLLISPRVVGNLTSAGATYDTPYGEVRSAWQIDGASLHLDVTVPANSTATVEVPTWAGRPAATSSDGLKPVGATPSATVFRVGSGNWTFVSHLPHPVQVDRVQLAVDGPSATVPLVAGQPGTAVFTVYNPMDHAVSVQPSATASEGFTTSRPGNLEIGSRQAVRVPVTVTAAGSATSGTVTLSAGDATAIATVERTDDLVRTATMSASSTHSKWDPARAGDGDVTAQHDYDRWNGGDGWNDGTSGAFPDTLTATWQAPVTLDRVVVYTLDTDNQPAARYGVRDYDVQVLRDGGWETVASVRGNTAATVTSTFAGVQADALRLVISDSNDHSYSRVVELAAFAS